jgi:hypothetical protein
MFGGLFKFVKNLISSAVSKITKQANIIEQSVTAPLRSLVGEVTGGIWKGEGANRFVQEMTSEVIPMLVNIMMINFGFAGAIIKGMNRTEQAINQATTKAQSLIDISIKIY